VQFSVNALDKAAALQIVFLCDIAKNSRSSNARDGDDDLTATAILLPKSGAVK
jgi:hypothetical protein